MIAITTSSSTNVNPRRMMCSLRTNVRSDDEGPFAFYPIRRIIQIVYHGFSSGCALASNACRRQLASADFFTAPTYFRPLRTARKAMAPNSASSPLVGSGAATPLRLPDPAATKRKLSKIVDTA